MSGSNTDDIELEAADWIVRASEPDFSREDVVALNLWLGKDPRHRQAYARLHALWREIPRLPGIAGKLSLAANDKSDARTSFRGGFARPSGWAGLAVAASAIIALMSFLHVGIEPAEHFTTGLAQVSKITLSDGTAVTLGPKSTILVTFSDRERRLHLANGEAFFDVADDSERAFVVEVGGAVIRDIGTRFNVKRGSSATNVAVLDGIVMIAGEQSASKGMPTAMLHRGEQAMVTSGSRSGVSIRKLASSDDLEKFGAMAAGWRDGWLVYENARLGDVVEDINRYYAPGVQIADSAIGDLRVTASFKSGGVLQFVRSLDQLFPVTVRELPNGAYRLD